MSIASNLEKIIKEIHSGIKLVAVSKTNTTEKIMEAYNAGQRIFGESKVQELLPKFQQLPKDIEWHFIGHLQTNKIKYITPFISLIHSIDSLQLLEEVNKQAIKSNNTINCLLQVHIAEEETKFGFDEMEIMQIIESDVLKKMKNINIRGLMGMATLTENETQIRKEFRNLRELFYKLKTKSKFDEKMFTEISMGMSSDYKIAIEEGSNLIRVGSKIFGERSYS